MNKTINMAVKAKEFETYLCNRGISIAGYRRVKAELDSRDPNKGWSFKLDDGSLHLVVRNVVSEKTPAGELGIEVWSEDGKTQLFAA